MLKTEDIIYLLCHRTRSTNTIEHRTQENEKEIKNNSKKEEKK